MEPIQHIFSEILQPRKIVITIHQKPDGDAMGSSLALYHFLSQIGHFVYVISPTNWAGFLNWMPGIKQVLDYDRDHDNADRILHEEIGRAHV